MPPILIVLTMAVVFTTAMAVGQSAYWAYIAQQERQKKELARRLGTDDEESARQGLIRDRAADAAAQALGRIGAHLQDVLEAADNPDNVSKLLTQMLGVGIVVFLICLLVIGFAGGLVFGFIAGLIPYMLMRRAGSTRQRMLVEQLPDSLDLISRSLQAGVGLNDTFRMVAEEMPMPIAGEFGRVFEEVRFGRDFRQALELILVRNPGVFDLRLFVSSVLLARETGGNLIEILDNISNTIRDRFLFDAKVAAMTSEAKFSGLILAGLPLTVGLIVAVTNPTYLFPLIEDPLGNIFIGFSVCSYGTGLFAMNIISDVQV